MPINKAFEGKEYPATAPFEVTAQKIREFADAIGDPNPVYRDESAAKAAGHANIIAPPTFLTKLGFESGGEMLLDPELGLNLMMVVHGDQEFSFVRPVYAGDSITTKPKISSILIKGRNEFLVTEAAIETTKGETIGTARVTIVSRGTAPQEA